MQSLCSASTVAISVIIASYTFILRARDHQVLVEGGDTGCGQRVSCVHIDENAFLGLPAFQQSSKQLNSAM
jgi:hypothetical protein